MEPLRILHLHFGREGGAERFFVNLAAAFDDRGIDQQFVIRPNRTWRADVARIGRVSEGNFSHLASLTQIMQFRVRRICTQWDPDVIMAWMPVASRLLPTRTRALRITRLGDYPRHLRHFQKSDVLVANQPGIFERVQNLGWPRPVHMISNFSRSPVPNPLPRNRYGTPEDAFLVTAGGRFVRRKGLDLAIRAVAKLPSAWLWLMGEGEEKAKLEGLAADLGIADRVKFLGWIDEPIDAISASNAFVLPSRHEPLGNMLLEAWHAGVPTVSSRSEGPNWFMRDGVDGILVDIDHADGIADGLKRLQNDPDSTQLFVDNARARLASLFDRDAVVDAYLEIFQTR